MFWSDNTTDSDTCWPCCASAEPPFVTHRCLVGGAAGGTSVWYADRGGLNGLPALRGEWQFATCRRIRLDDAQVYTAGDKCLDPFEFSGNPNSYLKSLYCLKSPLVGFPATFTIYEDSSAGGAFNVGVMSVDSTGTVIGDGASTPVPFDATAADILNAINATCDSESGTGYVVSGDYTVTGGPLPGTPIVVTPAGRLAGTASSIGVGSPGVQQVTSDYRNSVEAWDKTDGANVWKVSLNEGANQLLVTGSTLIVAQQLYGYFTDCGPVFCYPVYYFDASGNLTCWNGDLGGGANKDIAPDPVDGYVLIRTGSGYGAGAFASPIPWDASASDVQSAFAAAGVSVTTSGGPLPGTPINVNNGTGHPAGYCVTSDTLIGPFDAGIALRALSTADGSQLAQNSWGMSLWGNIELGGVYSIAMSGSTLYVSGSTTGGFHSYAGGPTLCQADGVNTRKFDTSLDPLGDLDGAIGSNGAWSVCFNGSNGYCYSASENGVLAISSDFKTGGFAFTDLAGGHLLPAGHVAIKSDNSVVAATWSNQVGTFSPTTGACIAQATIPGFAAPGAGAGNFNELCIDDNGFVYVALDAVSGDFPAPGRVVCFDSSMTFQWEYLYQNSDATVFGRVLTICCEPDGSFVYFGGSRIPVGPRP